MVLLSLKLAISYTFKMTGSRFPMFVGSNSSLPLSFGTPKQLGNGKLHGRPFENIIQTNRYLYIELNSYALNWCQFNKCICSCGPILLTHTIWKPTMKKIRFDWGSICFIVFVYIASCSTMIIIATHLWNTGYGYLV